MFIRGFCDDRQTTGKSSCKQATNPIPLVHIAVADYANLGSCIFCMGHCVYAFLSVLFDLLYVRVACFIQQDGMVMNIPPSLDRHP